MSALIVEKRRLLVVVLAALLVLVGSSGAALYSRLLLNIGNVTLLASQTVPAPHSRRVEEQLPSASPSLGWFRQAAAAQPGDRGVWAALARAAAMEERWEEATAAYLAGQESDVARVYFSEGHVWTHVVWGLVAAGEERWSEALRQYRIALALGPGRIPRNVYPLYFRAIAGVARTTLERDPTDGRSLYLLGLYRRRLGNLEGAAKAHGRLLTLKPAAGHAWELAQAHLTLGMAAERSGRKDEAVLHYAAAVRLEPHLTEAWWRLAALEWAGLSKADRESLQATLASLEPTYPIGHWGPEGWVTEPAAVAEGWRLAGLDADRDALEQGGPVGVTLYWLGTGATQAPADWLFTGRYWLQRIEVENLAPNAGFEWEGLKDGVPLGYVEAGYGAPLDSYRVVEDVRNGRRTRVLLLDNALARYTGVATADFPVQPTHLYVQAGWRRDAGNGNLGRGCAGPDLPGAPWYIVYGHRDRMEEGWRAFAEVSTPREGLPVDRCQIALNNVDSAGRVYYDDLLLFELPVTALRRTAGR